MSESEISVVYAREHFAEYLGRVTFSKDRVVVTKHGKKVAAVVPYEDLQLLEKLEEVIDLKEAKAALEDVKKHGSIPWQKVKSKLGLSRDSSPLSSINKTSRSKSGKD